MRPRVLIVDDSLTVRMDIGEALQSAGFDTVLCADLRSAREALAREGAILIVLDILLPDGDGLDFLNELRSSPATARIPVLLLSTEAEVKNRVREMGAGAEEYIGKPYDLGQVVARARTLTHADTSATGGETSPSLLGPTRLLAVDDSITYLQELGSQLRQEGYDVVLATSGEEALELLAARPVDCILLDLMMPGLSGQDTCRRIKQRAEWRDIPLVMLTARDDRQAMIDGINAGADDYIAKSADFDVLKARLRAQLRRKHFEDENRRIREKLVRSETEATARKQVEAERAKLDQRLRDLQFYTRSLIESNIDALMTTDPSGIITDVNKEMEALTGCTRDELIGAPFKNYFTDSARAEAAINLVLREKRVTNYELTARARDGTTTVVSYNASTFYDRDRTLQGVFAAARDVTERKRLDQALEEKNVELEQANHLKDEFLATVSHELRTPLNAILGWARMLASTPLPPDRTRHAIGTIERNAAALALIIDDLLDMSRIVAGTLHLAPQPVDLVAVTQATLDAVRPSAVTKHLHLAFSPDVPAVELVPGDAGRLQQVISNLLTNAIKFTPEGGRVDVFIERSNDHVEVRVVDTGQGISPDFLPYVFERFRQADGATTRRHTGLGLGLAIVRQLVELHGGTVHAASEGVGHGATFTVSLPMAAGGAR